ncbi:phytoene desaturase family protein [Micrococcus luteus]
MRAARTVVVVGGGFAGLATAGLLARDGHDVTLVEKNPALGGRAGRWSAEGFTFDTGPSWYLMPEVIDRWFRLMGTSAAEQLDLQHLDPAYRVFAEDHLADGPTDVRGGTEEACDLFESLEPGAGMRLRSYLASASRTYALAKRRFLYTDFDRPWELVHREVLAALPALGRQLAGSLWTHVTRRFEDVRLRQVLAYPAVFLGTSPRRAPAMYHLMSHLDLVDGVQYPRGGFAALVDAMEGLCRAEGVRILVDTEVTAVEVAGHDDGRLRGMSRRLRRPSRSGTRATGVRVLRRTADDTDAAGELRLPADVVVGAADLHHLQTRLLPPSLRAPESRWDRRDPGFSGVLVCLGVRGRLPQLLHHSLLFTADWDENFARIEQGRDLPDPTSVYVSRTTATDPDMAPPGDESLFLLVPSPAQVDWGHGGVRTPGRDEPGDAQVEAVADRAVAQLAEWAGIPDLAERVVVRRTVGPADLAEQVHAWRGSLLGPGHVLRQSALFRPVVRDRRIRGLFYAGSSVRPGIGVPMCLISAEIVREAVSGVRAGADEEVSP